MTATSATPPRLTPLTVHDAAGLVAADLQWPQLTAEGPAGELLVVDVDEAARSPQPALAAAASRIAASDRVVAGIAAGKIDPAVTGPLLSALTFTVATGPSEDLRVVRHIDPPAALADVAARVAANPAASMILRQVLPVTAGLPAGAGLRVESLAYSTLLAGPEFRAWLATRRPRRPAGPGRPPVRAARDGDTLRVELDDPDRHNAYSASMREALLAALSIADLDPTVRAVRLTGNGPSFCSGGDLTEFGTGPGGSTAHFIRTQRAPGALLHRLRGRVHVELHGSCIGAGIELAAFAGRVTARRDTTIMLPEIAMGLIPGAGGTVSITKRIGRWRSAYLALSGAAIDAPTACAWGLADELAAADR
jgi:Enoyl-CoA hydratase/isomerase